MSQENCDSCHVDYDITPRNAVVFIYLNHPKANHVRAKCPSNHMETYFTDPESLILLTKAGGFVLHLELDASKEIIKSADDAWRAQQQSKEAEAPKDVPVYDIPPSLARLADRFTETVEAMPDDLLYDEITMENPSDLPATWRGEDTRPGDSQGDEHDTRA